MRLTRRDFVKATAAGGVGIAALGWPRRAQAFFQTKPLRKFVEAMRTFGAEIPALTPDTTRYQGVDYYTITMRQFTDQLHQDLGGLTTLWGYGAPGGSFKHLGGAIVARRGVPVRVTYINELPDIHPLPVDMTVVAPYEIPGGLEVNRAAPHLHGGLVPWPSDGGPYHWFSSTLNGATRVTGPSVTPWLPDENGVLTDDYWYPNDQSARLMWYHDHAVGITRLNAYAGLASGYILTEPVAEAAIMEPLGIPAVRQIPIAFQDKVFSPDGSLWYPDTYETQFFALAPGNPLPVPSLVPEFWGDTILANGTAYPYFEVEPRRYRLRLLNACNTRVLSLKLVYALGKQWPDTTEPDLMNPGPVMTVIGTEGGFLDGAVVPQGVAFTNMRGGAPLLLAPGERVDMIVDFSKVKPGQFLILHNDAPVPFPGGTPLADFYPQNKNLVVPPALGMSPNTRTLLQFRVVTATSPADPIKPAWALPAVPAPAPTVATPRDLALYETVDAHGRLAQNLGTLAGFMEYKALPTEVVSAGSVETWRIFNLTADTHPIHFHYFNVRVLSRQAFNMAGGAPNLIGKPIPPELNEEGWKETVRMNPGECTTVLVEVPPTAGLAPAGVEIPASPRLATFGDAKVAGAEYVWHCHILEHEEHDMMRPLVVQG